MANMNPGNVVRWTTKDGKAQRGVLSSRSPVNGNGGEAQWIVARLDGVTAVVGESYLRLASEGP